MVKVGDRFRYNRKGSPFKGDTYILCYITGAGGLVLIDPRDGLNWSEIVPYTGDLRNIPSDVFKECFGFSGTKHWTLTCGAKLPIE